VLAQGGDAGGEEVLLASLTGAQGGGKTKAGGALPWAPWEPPLIVRMITMGRSPACQDPAGELSKAMLYLAKEATSRDLCGPPSPVQGRAAASGPASTQASCGCPPNAHI